MKFQRNTIISVLVASAGLSQASAFVPAASFVGKFSVGVGSRLSTQNLDVFFELASASDVDKEKLELIEFEKEWKNEGWSKLMKMKDFDPDDEDDDELVKEVLDTAIDALEEDVSTSKRSSFRTALSILRLLRSQIRKAKSMKFTTYPNNPEVSLFTTYSIITSCRQSA